VASAAGVSVTIQEVDGSAFPTVRLSVLVADGEGVPITGLDMRAFDVREDDKPVSGLQIRPSTDPARQSYVLEYTSSRPPDEQPHPVSVKATYLGQTAEASGTLQVRRAPPSPVPVAPAAASPVPSAAPSPAVVVASPVLAAPSPVPTLVPTPVAREEAPDRTPLLLALLALLLLAAAGVGAFLSFRRRRPEPAPAPVVEVADRTEFISRGALAGLSAAAAVQPNGRRQPAKLIVSYRGTQREVVLDADETVLGRDAANPVFIPDPQASRHHAKISYEHGDYWLQDLMSVNGTRVNGEEVKRRKLTGADKITIGDAVLTFVPG
jgi:hypothetical protein